MMRFRIICSLMAVCCLSAYSYCQVTLIDDDLNVDTSTDYTVVNGGWGGGGDGELLWAYDYGALGIPAAPGTTDGSTTGVRMSVNDSLAITESTTVFHNTEIVGVTDYTMTMDVWLNVWAPSADTGTTESGQFGVGADNTVRNHLFEFANVGQDPACCEFSGSGHFIALSADGGDGSDYRHWRDDANGSGNPGPVNQFDPDYLSPDNNTDVNGDNFLFFEQIANINAPFPGVIGGAWATVKIEVSQTDQKVRYYVRGATAATTGGPGQSMDDPEFIQVVESDLFDPEGFVNFGLADMYTSVATVPADQFAVFDNLFVEGSNETGGSVDGDFDNNGAWECNDVDQLVAEIVSVAGGATPDTAFDMTGDGNVDTADLDAWRAEAGDAAGGGLTASGNPIQIGDATLDGTVDGLDFIEWNNNKFTSVAAWCSGDFNADGIVDGLDFIEWNNNKFTSADAVSGVPEPGSLSLVMLALVGMALRRQR